jgi:hypothetical protein
MGTLQVPDLAPLVVDSPSVGSGLSKRRQETQVETLAPAKVQVIEQPALLTRAVLDKKEEEAKQAMWHISKLEDLVGNGNICLGEFKNSASRANMESHRQVAELEVRASSEQLRYAEVQKKMEMVEEASNTWIEVLQEALENDQADLVHVKERAAKAEEVARQDIIVLEKVSKEAKEAAYWEITTLKQALEND